MTAPSSSPTAATSRTPLLRSTPTAQPLRSSSLSGRPIRPSAQRVGGNGGSEAAPLKTTKNGDGKMLAISFVAMVVFALGNRVFSKLETVPMHNYPFFLALLTTFVYIPLTFAYIIPMILFGSSISKEERKIPTRKFMVMGTLDAFAGILQTFATNSLDGALAIMLTQFAIPVSMVLSYFLIQVRYNAVHIVGANVVLGGLAIALGPQFTQSRAMEVEDLAWVAVLALSCVPMTLSSIYKEKALGAQAIDPIYLTGQIAIWQFLTCVAFAVPSAYAQPGGSLHSIPEMVTNGAKCYMGINVTAEEDCQAAPVLVNAFLFFNVTYNVLVILVLKYGSANLLWLATALMVPLGSLTFSLPFVPGHKPLGLCGYIGLGVIVVGLMLYRFSHVVTGLMRGRQPSSLMTANLDEAQTKALLHNRGEQLDVTQYIFEGYTYCPRHQSVELKRGHERIRSDYLGRLGIRSPSLASLSGNLTSAP